MFGPDVVQEFEAGEGPGFEVDENEVELDLLELAEGVVGAVADVDFPGFGQLREVGFDLGKGGQIIVHHQNPTKLFHLYTVPAVGWSLKLSGLRVTAFKLSTCQERNFIGEERGGFVPGRRLSRKALFLPQGRSLAGVKMFAKWSCGFRG